MSLADLFAQLGTTPGAVAATVGVDSTLFVRVDQGRQPLPRGLARAIASALGVQAGDVEGAARLLAEQDGPVMRAPLPPDPFQGDPIPALPIAVTGPPPVAASPAAALKVVVGSTLTNVSRISRARAVVEQQGAFSVVEPQRFAVDSNGRPWSVSEWNVGRFNPNSMQVELEVDLRPYLDLDASKYICFEPVEGRIVFQGELSGHSSLIWLDATTGLPTGRSVDFSPLVARQVIAADGALYVVVYDSGTVSSKVHQYSLAGADVKRSTGTLGDVSVIAYDPGSKFLYVGGDSGTVSVLDESTLAATSLFSGCKAHAMQVAGGFLWVAGQDNSSHPIVKKVSLAGRSSAVVGTYATGGLFAIEDVFYDGAWVWAAMASESGAVLKINPNDMTVVLSVQVSGPLSLVVV